MGRNKAARSQATALTACNKPLCCGVGMVAGLTSGILSLALHVLRRQLLAKMPAALFHAPLTSQNPEKNHSEQHFWPNLFLGRWFKGLSWFLQDNRANYEAVGWECPRGSGYWTPEQSAASLMDATKMTKAFA